MGGLKKPMACMWKETILDFALDRIGKFSAGTLEVAHCLALGITLRSFDDSIAQTAQPTPS